MNGLLEIFGDGKNLLIHQMVMRGVVVFFVALLLIRISGRRSFGMGSALDNIIIVLLGAILSRAVVGASPFLATILTSLLIVCLHRFLAYGISINSTLRRIVEGQHILLYSDGKFIPRRLRRGLVCEEEVLSGVRKRISSESLENVARIYMERNGEITVVLKEPAEK